MREQLRALLRAELAARIAATPERSRLGGERADDRRAVRDIRDFTRAGRAHDA